MALPLLPQIGAFNISCLLLSLFLSFSYCSTVSSTTSSISSDQQPTFGNPLGITSYAQVTLSVPGNINQTVDWYNNIFGFQVIFAQDFPSVYNIYYVL